MTSAPIQKSLFSDDAEPLPDEPDLQPKLAHLVWIPDSKHEDYHGWHNSATWCFNLYFMQEEKNQDALREVIIDDPKDLERAIFRLFNNTQRTRRMCLIDGWCEGSVVMSEIIKSYLSDNPTLLTRNLMTQLALTIPLLGQEILVNPMPTTVSVMPPPVAARHVAPPSSFDLKHAAKLRTLADRMQKAIDDKFRDRLENTRKRSQEAMRKIEFNQRDYYPQGDAAWKKAHEEQMSRFKRLNDLHAELEAIAIHCSNFIKA